MSAVLLDHPHALKALKRYWGYESFRPLQAEAVGCVLSGRDSVVVLPTGGGKSLCYQLPAALTDGLTVVVSPLISLMKDQVDALNQMGINAACVNSAMTERERRDTWTDLQQGLIKLLYVAPERIVQPRFMEYLQRVRPAFVAIDEAHCISEWGHDFRPEYRELRVLKETLDGIPMHAYTATATPKVREDIARQLTLHEPETLVGPFERMNLQYHVHRRRKDFLAQAGEIIERYQNEAGIIYCIRRKDVDELCDALTAQGYAARPYHAGLSDAERADNQEAFIRETCGIVVATVAFGMGIDKPNVRYVIHRGMPKSLENYQQESGRAGRDGLEAECHLFYSGADFNTWQFLMKGEDAQANAVALDKLRDMYDYCERFTCRHAQLVGYFGQAFERGKCGKQCDVCLGGGKALANSQEVSKQMLRGVLELDERYGGAYLSAVLCGDASDARIHERGHDKLGAYGTLRDYGKKAVRAWLDQLIGEGCLAKEGDYNVLKLTADGMALLRGNMPSPNLPSYSEKVAKQKSAKAKGESWVGVDRELFEKLRARRRDIASAMGKPAYVIFGDATLRDLARVKPATNDELLGCHGVGEKKANQYGDEFVSIIRDYLGLAQGAAPPARRTSAKDTAIGNLDIEEPAKAPRPRSNGYPREQACQLYEEGASIEDCAQALRCSHEDAAMHLAAYLAWKGAKTPSPWIDEEVFQRVAEAAMHSPLAQPKTIRANLGENIPNGIIHCCLACLA